MLRAALLISVIRSRHQRRLLHDLIIMIEAFTGSYKKMDSVFEALFRSGGFQQF
jgi:hypothetical protein